MKLYLRNFTFLFLLWASELVGQEESYKLVGALIIESDQMIPFKLSFTVLKDGSLKGISETNFLSEDKTISEIIGQMDQKNKWLSFSEQRNLSTSSSAEANEFCYVTVTNLTWTKDKEKAIFNGDFIGKYPDGTQCALGKIYLTSMDMISSLANKNDKIKNLADSLKQYHFSQSDSNNQDLQANRPNAHGTINNQLIFSWNSEKLNIRIWDQFEEDNDMYSVFFNDSIYFKNEIATNMKKTYSFDFVGDTCTVLVIAENEGNRPPNTFEVQLVDSKNVHNLQSKLKKGETFKILFYRPRP